MRTRNLRTLALILLPLVLISRQSSAAVISIPNRSASTGQFVVGSVMLVTEGAQISSLQFDLEWDAGLSLQIVPGSELVRSGKLLYAAQLTPRSLRVLIARDRSVLADGELLRLFVAIGSQTGAFQIKITNLLGSTTDGDAVGVGASPAEFRVDSGPSGPALLPESVFNAASLRAGPIAPGEIITLLGNFGVLAEDSSNVVATVNGAPATVLYALGNQINAVAPVGLDVAGMADIAVLQQSRQIARTVTPVAVASPAVFTQSGNGIGPGAILNQDYSLNSPANPAAQGSVVMIYGTGFGLLDPPGKDGQPGVLSSTVLPVTVKIGSVPAEVLYSGAAPGLPNGLVQINVRVPSGTGSDSAAALELRIGSFVTSIGVTISVQ